MSTTSTGERRVIGNVLKGSVGNLIEWYDWYVYAAFSVYFAKEFFPEATPPRSCFPRQPFSRSGS